MVDRLGGKVSASEIDDAGRVHIDGRRCECAAVGQIHRSVASRAHSVVADIHHVAAGHGGRRTYAVNVERTVTRQAAADARDTVHDQRAAGLDVDGGVLSAVVAKAEIERSAEGGGAEVADDQAGVLVTERSPVECDAVAGVGGESGSDTVHSHGRVAGDVEEGGRGQVAASVDVDGRTLRCEAAGQADLAVVSGLEGQVVGKVEVAAGLLVDRAAIDDDVAVGVESAAIVKDERAVGVDLHEACAGGEDGGVGNSDCAGTQSGSDEDRSVTILRDRRSAAGNAERAVATDTQATVEDQVRPGFDVCGASSNRDLAIEGGGGLVEERQATGCIKAKSRFESADGQGRPSPVDHDRAVGRAADVQALRQGPVGPIGDIESRAVDDAVVAGEDKLGVVRRGQSLAGSEIQNVWAKR